MSTLNDWERLIDEIKALESIYSLDEEFIKSTELCRALQNKDIISNECLRFRILLDKRTFYSDHIYMEITIEPKNFYSSGIKDLKIVDSMDWESNKAPFFLLDSQRDLIIQNTMDQFIPNFESLFQQITKAKETTESIMNELTYFENVDITKKSDDTKIKEDIEDTNYTQDIFNSDDEQFEWNFCMNKTTLRWGQRACYSHHIRNPIKRRLIQEWAHDLYLGGFCKIGYPGIIIVEGPEDCCLEYIRRLQRLRWKHFVVRGEIIEEFTLPRSNQPFRQLLDTFRKLPNHMIQLPPDAMKNLAHECEKVGLKHLFLTTMKIYS
ncbi:uncharacterized protein CMU_014560 [Cryptosporidium muris RN66]|uniref:Small nuclear ribonucleoprotein Prp3 C-terminal domain-containing protein n=1 Tax=Cryptosporidium muris (strain RN66) TaxID=441375 RepID=B6AF13_CRYMR|nr:uncharacterized protein CMU_014560 [Cryptosporidium muris RN66]EEA06780.1 hypothetical protein, conserved [Cryptosporidium muris RN66]|eukprot:XP_002141129.1 hypothetical protein [Cryptosporidium muris RN66]